MYEALHMTLQIKARKIEEGKYMGAISTNLSAHNSDN